VWDLDELRPQGRVVRYGQMSYFRFFTLFHRAENISRGGLTSRHVSPCLANLWPHGLEDIFSDVLEQQQGLKRDRHRLPVPG
jgi:hypothetical protein